MAQRTAHWIGCFDSLGMQLSTAFTLDLKGYPCYSTLDLVGVAMLLH